MEHSDQALPQLFNKLAKGTGLPETQVFQVATRLQAAVNTPTAKPQILLLAGAKGSGVDELYQRLQQAAEGAVVGLSGANDLRMTDPMGRILGAPNGEAGLVASPLLKKDKDKRLVLAIDGAEAIGTAQQYEEDTATAQRSFYASMAQLQKTGTLRAYDGQSGEVSVDAHGGVIIIRDRRSFDELKDAIPSSVWTQLAPQVIDFGNASADSVLLQLQASLAQALKQHYGVADADVQMSAEAQNFMRDLLTSGMDAEMLQQFVKLDVLPRVMRAAYDDNLGSKIRIELSRGVRPKHLEMAKTAWLAGRQAELPGINTLFGLRDEGKFRVSNTLISAKLEKKLQRDQALEQAKLTIVGYQGVLKGADDQITALVRENTQRTARIQQLDEHVAEADWKNARAQAEITDLKLLHRLANEAIDELKAGVEKLNTSVEDLKGANTSLVDKLERAVSERDELKSALAAVQEANGGMLKGLAEGLASGKSAGQIFETVKALGPHVKDHPALGNFLDVLVDMGLQQATEAALQYQDRNFGKFNEIADLTGDYISACFAAGVHPRQDAIDAMHRIARTTGDYGNASLNNSWNSQIAKRTGLQATASVSGNNQEELMAWLEQQAKHTKKKFRDPNKTTQALRGLFNRLGIGV
jgi:hypothetical protein